ncbi:AhpD-like protein [Durotheca rogersii]|uniref:AhpD-like protein n=1 Tax=Durotheca rogersii TaxID=419775 RepID=UPI0022200686|nr:AhpD-like protein [Durotheca rogersii]KAI5867004.1 AhpD-like protein [Durotheca rogersii]
MAKEQNCLVPYLELEDAPPEVAAAITHLPYRRNIFHLLGHSHGSFPRLMGVYASFFDGSRRILPLLEWQLVVLRISAVLDAEYEWDVNAPVARINGMPEEKLTALKRTAGKGPAAVEAEPLFSARDRAILGIVDEQLATYNNTVETVNQAKAVLSVEDIVEVYVVLGVYVLIARITKGLRIDLDGEIAGLDGHLKGVVTGN